MQMTPYTSILNLIQQFLIVKRSLEPKIKIFDITFNSICAHSSKIKSLHFVPIKNT